MITETQKRRLDMLQVTMCALRCSHKNRRLWHTVPQLPKNYTKADAGESNVVGAERV